MTVKEENIRLRDLDTADEIRAAGVAWVSCYNTRRPHQAPDYATRGEYRARKLCRHSSYHSGS